MCPTRGIATIDDENDLVASAGAVGSLTDLGVLPQGGASTALFTNAYVFRPKANNAEDVIRQVNATGYAGTTQVITHEGPNWTEAPLAGTDDGTYLLLKDHPFLWDRALNVALKTLLFNRDEVEWTPTTSGQKQYTVGSAPLDSGLSAVVSASQIHNIQHHGKDEASNQFIWKDWFRRGRRQWRAYNEANSVLVEFIGPINNAPGTDDRMRFVTTLPLAGVTAESTAINVEPQWAAAATVLIMARWLADRNNPDDEWLGYAKDAQTIYNHRRRQALGELAEVSYGRSNTRAGGSSVGGRGGRGSAGHRRTHRLGAQI